VVLLLIRSNRKIEMFSQLIAGDKIRVAFELLSLGQVFVAVKKKIALFSTKVAFMRSKKSEKVAFIFN